ncbi:hypothetical protein IEQ34_001148 [Dendrobium chrysotoxum]|uniref:Uncharacterized protein n=1 Tax=Dendrobium chrysotoxum TaxID=161865 RepID=A0AAV7H627_DENCH|nr:hypothetical protein IEQ34_001148 [Dendrobium chrysotoxum]
MERTSTPSSMAASIPANISLPKHKSSLHTLYAAIWARAAIPTAVPAAFPKADAFETAAPAAVLAVCVPWPSWSTGRALSGSPVINERAPISLLLQRGLP